jgi:hypothetical protein
MRTRLERFPCAALLACALGCGGTTEQVSDQGGGGAAGTLADASVVEPDVGGGGGGAGGVRLDSAVDVRADPLSEAEASTCAPASLGAWQPTWVPPAAANPTGCTPQQIDDYIAKCQPSSNYASTECHSLRVSPANTACLACMFTTEDQPAWGPVIIRSMDWQTNISACLAMVDGDKTSTGCAAKYEAAMQCQAQSCYGSCAGQPFSVFSVCLSSAWNTTCSSYVSAAVCRKALKYDVCWHDTFPEYLRAYALMFCSTVPDAGPAPDGASADARQD